MPLVHVVDGIEEMPVIAPIGDEKEGEGTPAQALENVCLGIGIQVIEGLIDEEESGGAQEGAGEDDALLLAPAEPLGDIGTGGIEALAGGEQIPDACFGERGD